MKKMKFLSMLFSMLLAVTFVGCQSDSDDLEYDNPENIIVGTWKITKFIPGGGHFNFKPGTVLVFHNNGTFTDSSNGSKHTWKIASYKGGKSYTGGIYFDGIYYDIISLSNPKYTGERKESTWMVGLPDPTDNNNDSGDGGYIEKWELHDPTDNFDDNGSDESDSDPSSPTDDPDDSDPSLPSDAPDPDESEPSGGNGKLVSKIFIWSPAHLLQTIEFHYDNTNRVNFVVCYGPENNRSASDYTSFANGSGYEYRIYDSKVMEVGSCYNYPENYSGQIFPPVPFGFIKPAQYLNLNDMGYVVNDYTGNHTSFDFTYYEDGRTKSMYWGKINFSWDNGDIKEGYYIDGVMEERYFYTSKENKANLNLNKLFTRTYVVYGIYGDQKLALCGYLGKKDKHLLSQIEGGPSAGKFIYEFDEDGYPTIITYTPISYDWGWGYRCIIEYTTGGNYNFPVY